MDFALGERNRARALAEPALQVLARKLGEHHPMVAFDRARWAALEGDRAAALRWLRGAAERGFANPGRVTTSELGRWRSDPELKSILADMRDRGAAAPPAAPQPTTPAPRR